MIDKVYKTMKAQTHWKSFYLNQKNGLLYDRIELQRQDIHVSDNCFDCFNIVTKSF